MSWELKKKPVRIPCDTPKDEIVKILVTAKRRGDDNYEYPKEVEEQTKVLAEAAAALVGGGHCGKLAVVEISGQIHQEEGEDCQGGCLLLEIRATV